MICVWKFNDGRTYTTHATELELSKPHESTFTFGEQNIGRVDINVTCSNALSSKVRPLPEYPMKDFDHGSKLRVVCGSNSPKILLVT